MNSYDSFSWQIPANNLIYGWNHSVENKRNQMKNHNRTSDELETKTSKLSHSICLGLNSILANEFSLFTKTLNYHWNITGPRFHSLHTFLEGHYRELLEIMDSVAERVRILDERPIGTVKQMYSETEVLDSTEKPLMAEEMLQNLLRDHQLIKGQVKEILSDESLFKFEAGSHDFLVSLLQKHEMMAWMLKSHLV